MIVRNVVFARNATFALLGALGFTIPVALGGCRGCAREPSEDTRSGEGDAGARKGRVDVTIALGQAPGLVADAIVVDPRSPPTKRQTFERSGMSVAVVGVPREGDPEAIVRAEVAESGRAGTSALVVVTERCLADLQAVLTKNIANFWIVALVVGARCDGAEPTVGAATLVPTGSASRVTITFERTTRAFLKVQPAP